MLSTVRVALATLPRMPLPLRKKRLSLPCLFSLVLVGFLGACPGAGENAADLGVSPPPDGPRTVGLHADCTLAGWSDVVCAAGLRCGLVQLGEPPNQGSVSQCVPVADKPLALGDACQFDQGGAAPTGTAGPSRYYDRCGPGLGCVQTESQGWRCRTLCERAHRGPCGDELCVLPTQVSGTGYCTAADACKAVFPQTGCGTDAQGHALGCYALSDDKGGGTLCLRTQSFGDSTGAINSLCERAANCQPGLGCLSRSDRDPICRPYCELPIVPDGGTPPDLGGSGQVSCAGDLGVCMPISGVSGYGRCI